MVRLGSQLLAEVSEVCRFKVLVWNNLTPTFILGVFFETSKKKGQKNSEAAVASEIWGYRYNIMKRKIYSLSELLAFVLSKQIRMSARVNHNKNQFFIVLLPNKQPIRLYMTLPLSFSVAM